MDCSSEEASASADFVMLSVAAGAR